MAHGFGIRLALIGFAVIGFEQAWLQTDFETAIGAVLYSAGLFYLLGCVCGEIARQVIEEQVAGIKRAAAAAEQSSTPTPT